MDESRIAEDREVLERIQELESRTTSYRMDEDSFATIPSELSESEEQELAELRHRYYVENADVRYYWKTY